jgi:hypothetical protein
MMLYWATFDAKPFPVYGSRRGQIQVRSLSDRSFAATVSQAPAPADAVNVALSADGRRLTVTTRSPAANGDDVRVYDRVDAANWPTAVP